MKIKGNLMYRLLKIYSMTLLIIITIFAVGVSWINNRESSKRAERLAQNSLLRVSTFVEENQQKAVELAGNISNSEIEYQGLTRYFAMTDAEYLDYTLNHNYAKSNFTHVIQQLYPTNDEIISVSVDLLSNKERYLSDVDSRYGRKVEQLPPNEEIMFNAPLKDVWAKLIGNVYMTVNKEPLTEMLKQLSAEYTADVFLISERNQLVYTNSKNKTLVSELEEKLEKGSEIDTSQYEGENIVAETQVTVQKYHILSLVNKEQVNQSSRLFMFWMLFFSLMIDGVLLLLLYRLFNGYVFQIGDILVTIKQVSSGNRATRIPIENKKAELKDISLGINEMLESLDNFIRENYELELRQKDADFRALQAQINPHFMYNTLEYIRMYALSEGMEELSEVVFSFASILRNNISQKKMITLENELKFVEQYVYLYQMRYPKSIAYSFKIDQSLTGFEIPKFCLQPLVENYFAHGIDYTRLDNVISVYAREIETGIEIEIRDNGRGMDSQTLQKINDYLVDHQPYESQSIGIQNVNERLKIIFGEDYSMVYEETPGGGTTVRIRIRRS
ncbi:sensor histidine kinase [Vagococcus sp. BWB3-3]|uniref:Sensor histidine kinase n=1 Tax=Vagococcus allomyrinae TaxID=2794353 RepID=A0A940P861_9ENTE|nr:histidine kinase [Vagococcus allomyrinae]MBP1041461.1 sensor histidine kinase [Vagococcus allomyrinae]